MSGCIYDHGAALGTPYASVMETLTRNLKNVRQTACTGCISQTHAFSFSHAVVTALIKKDVPEALAKELIGNEMGVPSVMLFLCANAE